LKVVALKNDEWIYIGHQSEEMTNGRWTVPSTDKSGCFVFATVIISTQKEIGLFNCRNTDIVWSSAIDEMNTVSFHLRSISGIEFNFNLAQQSRWAISRGF
jgi:hypothetical protein